MHARSTVLAACGFAAIAPFASAQTSISFVADFMAVDQPRVAWMLQRSDNPAEILGPSEFFPYAILDTGANGVVLGAAAYFEFDLTNFKYGYDYNRYAVDRRADDSLVRYTEIGVAGSEDLDVLVPYDLNVWGKSDVSETEIRQASFALSQTVILGATGADRQSPADFGSFSAIIGMPAMVGRVTHIDLRPMAGGGTDVPGRPAYGLMLADFVTAAPPVTPNTVRVALTPLVMDDSHPGQQQPTDAVPTFTDVPLVTATASHRPRTQATSLQSTRALLLDTGAQTSILSTNWITALGYNLNVDDPDNDIVDINNDGQITYEDDFLEVGGLGGSKLMPLVLLESLTIGTKEGVDLVATDLVVGVLDIGGEGDAALLNGVLGMNFLTSGYSDLLGAGTGEFGRFTGVYLDFTTDGQWEMRLEVNPDYVAPAPEPTSAMLLVAASTFLLRRTRRKLMN